MKEKQGFRVVKNRTHPAITQLCVPYLEGHITREDSRKLEEHLAGCVECQEQMGIDALLATYGHRDWKQTKTSGAKIAPRKVVPFAG